MKPSELWCLWNNSAMDILEVYPEKFQGHRKMQWYCTSPDAPVNGTGTWASKLRVIPLDKAIQRLKYAALNSEDIES